MKHSITWVKVFSAFLLMAQGILLGGPVFAMDLFSVPGPIIPAACVSRTAPCLNLCFIFEAGVNILHWIFFLSVMLVLIVILYGAFVLITSGGNTSKVSEGRKAITLAVVGFLVMLFAWLVINTIFVYFVRPPGTDSIPWPWSQVSCTP